MRLTRFHVLIEDFPKRGEHVLYNTLSDELVGLDDKAREWLLDLSRSRRAGISPLEQSEVDWLRSERFLVEAKEEDDRAIEAFFEDVRIGDGSLLLTLMVTESCNMACPYCFEGAGASGPGIGPAIEDGIHRWVRRYMAENRLDTLAVQYFGGEPLLRKSFVLRTARRFSTELAELGGRFSCAIVTNGLLLDRPFVDQMRDFGLEDVKVTLDGDKATHDRWRPRRGGGGTFDTILENVRSVAGLVPVRIGANVRFGHEHRYRRLVERLVREGLAKDVVDLRFKPVLDLGCGPSSGKTFSDADCPALFDLAALAHRNGMAPEPSFALGPCGLHMSHYLAVDHAGRIFKCEATMSDPAMAIGAIGADSTATPRAEKPTSVDPVSECAECPYVPACAGGCRAVTWAHEGQLGANCERAYFESAGVEILKSRYLHEHYEGRMPSEAAA